MSGFAFQKLNGDQTTAHGQLKELEKANGKLDVALTRLAEVRDRVAELAESVSKPEIWKLARMFHPDALLTPVQWVRHNLGGGTVSTDGKLYYGRLQVQLKMMDFKGSARQWVDAVVFKDGVQQAKFMDMNYKSVGGHYPAVHEDYIGYVDGIRVWSNNPDCWSRFEFQGFEVGPAGSAPPPFVPPAPEPEWKINVSGLSALMGGGASVSYFSDGQWHEVFDGDWPIPVDATHLRLQGVPSSHHYFLYWNTGQDLAAGLGNGGVQVFPFPSVPLEGHVDVLLSPPPPAPPAPNPPSPPGSAVGFEVATFVPFEVLYGFSVMDGFDGSMDNYNFSGGTTSVFVPRDATGGHLHLQWFYGVVWSPEPFEVACWDYFGNLLVSHVGQDVAGMNVPSGTRYVYFRPQGSDYSPV